MLRLHGKFDLLGRSAPPKYLWKQNSGKFIQNSRQLSVLQAISSSLRCMSEQQVVRLRLQTGVDVNIYIFAAIRFVLEV